MYNYEELVEVMKQGLVEVSRKKRERRQPWFSKELAKTGEGLL